MNLNEEANIKQTVTLANEILRPHLEKLTAFSTDSEELKTGVVRLLMALGMALGILANRALQDKPEEIGSQVGEYITEIIRKLAQLEEEDTHVTKPSIFTKVSGWGRPH